MDEASNVELGGVLRAARHLRAAIDAADRLSDEAHDRRPTVRSARSTVRFSNSTLKTL